MTPWDRGRVVMGSERMPNSGLENCGTEVTRVLEGSANVEGN